MSTSDPMVRMRGVTFAYPDGPLIFDGFDWSVEAGDTWAVIGPSGCGKSTLLYLVAGLRRPHRGTVQVAGRPVDGPRPGTGLILQDHGLLPWATVEENVALGLRIRAIDGRVRSERVRRWLARLGIAPLARRYIGQISGGQRQRAAVARTLVLEPDLLLMDEPFTSLDAPTREELQELVLRLGAEAGITTLLVTHDIEEATFVGSKVLILRGPPVRRGVQLDNPDAGASAYRSRPEFHRRCVEVRRRMMEA